MSKEGAGVGGFDENEQERGIMGELNCGRDPLPVLVDPDPT